MDETKDPLYVHLVGEERVAGADPVWVSRGFTAQGVICLRCGTATPAERLLGHPRGIAFRCEGCGLDVVASLNMEDQANGLEQRR